MRNARRAVVRLTRALRGPRGHDLWYIGAVPGHRTNERRSATGGSTFVSQRRSDRAPAPPPRRVIILIIVIILEILGAHRDACDGGVARPIARDPLKTIS